MGRIKSIAKIGSLYVIGANRRSMVLLPVRLECFIYPVFGNMNIGWWYIPIFMFIISASAFSANETDGLDGLLGESRFSLSLR